jgi:hypothetical protein
MMKRLLLLIPILLILTSCTHPAYKDEVFFGDVYSHGVLLTPGGSSTWGSITGTLSLQTDLSSSLSGKQSISEKGAVSGYAGLGTNSLVPTAQLGTGIANSSSYLRGDQTWGSPTASAAWGSITGTLSLQTDLDGVLSAKQASSAILTGLSSLSWTIGSPIVRMTGTGTFMLDSTTYLTGYTETDPIVKALTGIIVSNGSAISSITDNSSNWNTAYGWGNHASAGYLSSVYVDSPLSGSGTSGSHLTVDLSSKQNVNSNLTSLSGLSYASDSFVKMTGTNTFTLDTATYLTSYTETDSVVKGLVDAKGDILAGTADNTLARLAVGSVNGQIIVADSSTASGLKWVEPPLRTLMTTTNQTINEGAGTYVDITGLTFPVTSGNNYAFKFYIVFRSAATTTGYKVSVNCPTGTLDFFCTHQTIANSATVGVATWLQRHSVTRDDMTTLTATITANVDLVVMIEGRYLCTENGTFAARFANELAANTDITVRTGSYGYYFVSGSGAK